MVKNPRLEQVLREIEALDERMGMEWPLEVCEQRAQWVSEVGLMVGGMPEIGIAERHRLEDLARRTAEIATSLREQRAQWQNTMQDLETEKRQLRAFDTEAAGSSSLLDRLA